MPCDNEEFPLKTGIIYHEDFKKYDFGPLHPMKGKYLDGDAAFALLGSSGVCREKVEVNFYKPVSATDEEIVAVHSEEYVDFVKSLNETGGMLTVDTPIKRGMFEVARLFAGAAILGGTLVVNKVVDKSFAFNLMGHHVGMDFGGGFGIINDTAIMVEYLRKRYGLTRVAIIDYAANTGHGTESIYYEDPEVLCIDIHQDPLGLYPATGFPEQVGRGNGQGFTINVPLPPFITDDEYLCVLHEVVVPVVEEYMPEVIVAVGLNGCHYTVGVNQFMLTLNGLKKIVSVFSKLSDRHCQGRFIHIGGFSLDDKLLPLGFLATVAGAIDAELNIAEPYELPDNIPEKEQSVGEAVTAVRDVQKKYWKCFAH